MSHHLSNYYSSQDVTMAQKCSRKKTSHLFSDPHLGSMLTGDPFVGEDPHMNNPHFCRRLSSSGDSPWDWGWSQRGIPFLTKRYKGTLLMLLRSPCWLFPIRKPASLRFGDFVNWSKTSIFWKQITVQEKQISLAWKPILLALNPPFWLDKPHFCLIRSLFLLVKSPRHHVYSLNHPFCCLSPWGRWPSGLCTNKTSRCSARAFLGA